MKLLISVISRDDRDALANALIGAGYGATIISTIGGFLRQGNATVLVGTDEANVDNVLDIIKRTCHTHTQYVNPLPMGMEFDELCMTEPVEVQVGGAVIFVVDVERMVKF